MDWSDEYFEEDKLGMKVTTGNVTIKKDNNNLIGISIGGGAPYCPCLYIVQVFDNSPTAKDGTLQSGDEIIGINAQSVKGKTKVEVAKLIQNSDKEVNIGYNKLHADPQQGKSLDIILKKVKHRLVEHMSTETADALGLSRAILCNDSLVQKLKELENIETTYRGLVEHATRVMKAFYAILKVYKAFGDCFANIGVRDPHPQACEVFSQFGDYHRKMEKLGIQTIKAIKPVLSDLGTYLNKAIPDTKLTIQKYADAKFEYLSYCLKVKEMDDEELGYASLQEILYRVDTGNYEYRLILRCRQDARNRFAHLRSDVLVKLELLDNKHIQDVVWQLQRFVSSLAYYHTQILEILNENKLFPIEVDLAKSALEYDNITQDNFEDDDDDDDLPNLNHLNESHHSSGTSMSNDFGGTNSGDILEQLENLKMNEMNENENKTENVLSNFESLTLGGDDTDILNLNSFSITNDLLTGEPIASSAAPTMPVISDTNETNSDLLF
ncbi:PRKCA-binding protein isoform X2 [Planococcus citri]|uniref:PRKCA-binding protein isoform X2 n=1 Tax=Planococcus citri TaxID=170843 RepID=UPI0031FA447D